MLFRCPVLFVFGAVCVAWCLVRCLISFGVPLFVFGFWLGLMFACVVVPLLFLFVVGASVCCFVWFLRYLCCLVFGLLVEFVYCSFRCLCLLVF